jgi:hypothetical protein
MFFHKMRPLDDGYRAEVDALSEQGWCEALQKFDDANIYQTWSYGKVMSGRNVNHLVLRRENAIVAIAQARIAKLPMIPVGIAYVMWGPMWRRGETDGTANTFRQAIRALRNEFVCKRRLTLRVFPLLLDDGPHFSRILAEEGFSVAARQTPGKTILMDLAPSLDDLREGMKAHWQRELKVAERNRLEIMEGTGQDLLESFIEIYNEMVSRKRFVEPNDINRFKLTQEQLPEQLKMRVMLCRAGEDVCAGAVYSAIGKTAIYLFGATSNTGMKSRGSYLLQSRLIQQVKRGGAMVYDLNGINPVTNPGTYKFKSDLAGRNGKEVCYLGRFESHGTFLSYLGVHGAEKLRSGHRWLTERGSAMRAAKLWPRFAR